MQILVTIIFASLLVTSCGGGSNKESKPKKEVKPNGSSIEGPLANYLSIVQIPYLMENPFNIKLKCLKEMEAELINKHSFAINIVLKDKNGMPITNGELSSTNSSDIKEILQKIGSEKIISLSNYSFNVNEHGASVSSFSISSIMEIDSKDVEINLGDSGNTNYLEFKVVKVSDFNSGSYVPNHEDNEKYIAAQIQLKNISDESIELDLPNITLTDQDGAEYQEQSYFTDERKKPVVFGKKNHMITNFTLKPGEKVSGWVTFTTEENSKAKQISLKTSSYGNVVVNL